IRDITERAAREFHRTARQAVRRILAEASSLDAAIPAILRGLCGNLKWDLGALWLADEQTELRRAGLWHAPRVAPSEPEVVNPAAEEIFRLPRSEALGRNLSSLLPAGPAGRFRLSLAEYLATRKADTLARRVEMTCLRADGSDFPIELTVTPIRMGENVDRG